MRAIGKQRRIEAVGIGEDRAGVHLGAMLKIKVVGDPGMLVAVDLALDSQRNVFVPKLRPVGPGHQEAESLPLPGRLLLRVRILGRGAGLALDRGQHHAGRGLLLAAGEGQAAIDATLQLVGLLLVADRLLGVRIVNDDQVRAASLS